MGFRGRRANYELNTKIRNYEYKKITIILFIILVLIDQLSKYTIRHLGGFYICNRGVAFGFNYSWLAATLLLIIIILFFIFQIFNFQLLISNKISKSKCQNWKLEIGNCRQIYLPLILIAAGGISNLIDRTHYGCVIDFIDLKIWPVFNVADVFITVGGIMIILNLLKSEKEKV